MTKRVALAIAGVVAAGAIGFALVAGLGGGGPQPVKCGYLTCAAGQVGQPCTMGGYPGMVVRSGPKALACDPSPGRLPSSATAAAPPPQPSPVSTAASLTGNCVMGYELPAGSGESFNPDQYAGFTPGTPQGETVQGNYYAPALAYQLTLTNDSANTADVSGFAVVFYDASGTEAGSDQQGAAGFITPGQSLTWTELASTTTNGDGDGGNDPAIPGNAATCQLVQWYHQ